VTDTAIQALATVLAASIAAFAAIKASKAEKNSRPVSNGFAKTVTSSLERIEKRIDEHLRDHSNR